MRPVPDHPTRPFRRVTLVKTSGVSGLPLGEEFEWTYTSSTRPEAVQRAYRALRREYPTESPSCWTERERARVAS